MFRIFFISFFIFFVFCTQTYSVEYDDSIDSDIRKQYNVDELPELPKMAPSKTVMHSEKNNTYIVTGKTYTIKSGTKMTLLSQNKISDWSKEGSKVSFLLQNPIMTKEGVVIPEGTLLKAVIKNSHRPQMTGNGGLIELKINEIYYNGILSIINTKITEVNAKRIHGSKLKGKRKYWENCAKAMTPGIKTYKIMKKTAKELTVYPIVNILSIIPITIGSVVYIINIPVSPAASAFMKGGSISLSKNTVFQIIVSGDNKIKG